VEVRRSLSFRNFGVRGFRSLEGERSGHSRGENPKSEVTTKDFGISGNSETEDIRWFEDIGLPRNCRNKEEVTCGRTYSCRGL
jgi:hypothetical protein